MTMQRASEEEVIKKREVALKEACTWAAEIEDGVGDIVKDCLTLGPGELPAPVFSAFVDEVGEGKGAEGPGDSPGVSVWIS